MSQKYLQPDDVLATVFAAVMEEYEKAIDAEGEKSVGSDELRALSHEISLLADGCDFECGNDSVSTGPEPASESEELSAGENAIQAIHEQLPPADLKELLSNEQKLRDFAEEIARDMLQQHAEDIGPDRDETLSFEES